MRNFLTLILSLVWAGAVAQIRLVPRSVLDSIANPRTVKTALVVEQQRVDFGRITEADKVEYRVAVKNVGTETMTYRTVPSCRCLKVTDGVVRAGERGEIVISFSGKGLPGPFTHMVSVYAADMTTPTAVIWVRGYVKAGRDHRGDYYPYTCGALLLRQPGVKIRSNSIECIACMNNSDRAVTITQDSLLSSAGIEACTYPRTLQAGQEGDLLISIRGQKQQNMKLFIVGEYAPSKREIKIE